MNLTEQIRILNEQVRNETGENSELSLQIENLTEQIEELNSKPFIPTSKKQLKGAIVFYVEFPVTAKTFLPEINLWNTSLITDMSYLFGNIANFSGNISAWDASNVTDMSLSLIHI